MARTKQLDLFSKSRTQEYRNSHSKVTRHLQTVGAGDRRVERMVNRISGRQSLKANKSRMATSLIRAARRVTGVKNALRKSGVRVKRSSFGSKGG